MKEDLFTDARYARSLGYRGIVSFTLWPGAAVMVASGLLSFGLQWRTVFRAFAGFGNVPDPLYWAFYATVGVMLLVVAWLVSLRVQNYERGKPDNRRTTRANAKRRLEGFRSGVWMQTLLRDPAAAVLH